MNISESNIDAARMSDIFTKETTDMNLGHMKSRDSSPRWMIASLMLIASGAVACGPMDDLPFDEDAAAFLATDNAGEGQSSGDPTSAVVATCSGESQTTDTSSTGYRGNPDGVSCGLAAKFNGDIDGGFDMSKANYDKFEKCMIDSGCFSPGEGMTLSQGCYKKLAACQKHLIGKAKAKRLKVNSKERPKNASTWRALGKKL
jgi:hypothetical protein